MKRAVGAWVQTKQLWIAVAGYKKQVLPLSRKDDNFWGEAIYINDDAICAK